MRRPEERAPGREEGAWAGVRGRPGRRRGGGRLGQADAITHWTRPNLTHPARVLTHEGH